MKIQYSFLKDYLSTDLSQPKLADVFTKVGFECESDGQLLILISLLIEEMYCL